MTTSSTTVFFGPELTRLNQGVLVRLRSSLLKDPGLVSFRDEITQLPCLWPAIQGAFSGVEVLRGSEQLGVLKAFVNTGAIPNLEGAGNVLLAPLTVISHVVDFAQLARKGGSAQLAETSIPVMPTLRAVQGFCIGFLAASAVASSKDWTQFQKNCAVALRLAVCIGAVIDADQQVLEPEDRSVAYVAHWKNESDRAYVETLLDAFPHSYVSCVPDDRSLTLTLPSRHVGEFTRRASEEGIRLHPLGLQGRFHSSTHAEALDSLKELCKQDGRFMFPGVDPLVLPLRSNYSAEVIVESVLAETALTSILTRRAHWFQTVKATLREIEGPNPEFCAIGGDNLVPSKLLRDARTGPENDFTGGRGVCPYPRNEVNGDVSRNTGHEGNEVAVIGMACRFPMADTLEEFWEIINSGKSTLQSIPLSRFDMAESARSPKTATWGNFLRNPGAFDHRFFNISGREAKSMDPQQRLLLQVAYEALESAGYCSLPSELRPRDVGCYVGVGSVDYEDNVASEDANAFSATGTLRAFITGRVSHYFGWTGPSMTFDTACSSSAVAIHSACKALQNNECSVALAGGVNVITSPSLFQNLSAAAFLSPTGASRAFDSGANGYCRGEGAGIVVLKPLAKALADGDSILSVIAGSAVNQGANCSPITVPDAGSQRSLYEKALSLGGIHPMEVSYVEAHGTGTPVGDPIEYDSVRETFMAPKRNAPLFLGSVKDNIGHAEAASGVAGLVKTILMMQKRIIAKQAHFVSLSPRISPQHEGIVIPRESQSWEAVQPRVAVVNNYGAGGSNAAIVIRENSESSGAELNGRPAISSHRPSFPFVFAAKSAESLRAWAAKVQEFVVNQGTPGLALGEFADAIARRQDCSFNYRVAFTAKDLSCLVDRLGHIANGSTDVQKSPGIPPVVLCFGGQTGDSVGLSREVFERCKPLQTRLAECDSACKSLGLASIFPDIFQSEKIADLVKYHCVLFSVQYSSARSILDCGLQADTLVGHSFGQLTALCVGGALSIADALYLISERARLMRDHWGSEAGVMLAVEGGDRQNIEALVDCTNEQEPNRVNIVCYNGTKSFVLGGDRSSIEAIESICRSHESSHLKLNRLQNSHAYHSYLADNILPGLDTVARSIKYSQPQIPVETCSPGSSWVDIGPAQIVEHTRQPVYFAEAVERIAGRLGPAVWIEAGSASPIIPMIRRILGSRSDAGHVLLPLNLRGPEAETSLAVAACELWKSGSGALLWTSLRPGRPRSPWINLPPYQFEKTRHWIQYKPKTVAVDSPEPKPNNAADTQAEILELIEPRDPKPGDNQSYLFRVNRSNPTYDLCVRGHAVVGQSLCPASLYVELAVRGAVSLKDSKQTQGMPHVEGLTISSPLGVSTSSRVLVRLSRAKSEASWEFSIFSQSQERVSGSTETLHATGQVSLVPTCDSSTANRLRLFKRLIGTSQRDRVVNAPTAAGLSGPMVYKVFGSVVDYAHYYRGVTKVVGSDREAIGNVQLAEPKASGPDVGECDPVAIDNFLQVAGIHVNCLADRVADQVFVCTSINAMSLTKQFLSERGGSRLWEVYTKYDVPSKGVIEGDIFVFSSATGALVAMITGAIFRSVPFKSLEKTLSKLNGNSVFNERDVNGNSGVSSRTNGVQIGSDAASTNGSKHDPTEAMRTSLNGFTNSGVNGHVPEYPEPNSPKTSSTETFIREARDMIGDILEIPLGDIQPDSTFEELGVDSLITTEVLAEIKKRFEIEIAADTFQKLDTLRALGSYLQQHGSIDYDAADPEMDTPLTEQSEQAGAFVTSQHSFKLSKATYGLCAQETGFLGFSSTVLPLQSRLVVAYVVEAFADLGCDLASMPGGQKLPPISHIPKHKKLMPQLFKILEQASLVTKGAGSLYRSAAPVPTTSATELHALMLSKFPRHASETKLLRTTGPRLADCLAGNSDPLALLFKDAKARALLEDVYTNAPMFKAGTIVVSRYLSRVIDSLEGRREVKILELGAGTGGTTRGLLRELSKYENLSYTFSDLSASLVAAAKKKFAKHKFMSYAVLDIEKDPAPQNVGQYDIIISTNCVHATRNLEVSCGNINKMLTPDGTLCLVELTRNLFWFDLVFGLLEGWWVFDDGREHALAHENRWQANLRSSGFKWVDWTDDTSEESKILKLIVASPTADEQGEPVNGISGTDMPLATQETLQIKKEDGVELLADVYYPTSAVDHLPPRPVALMIHGGGHIMLSRKDIRPSQVQILLASGFLPISVDYRLCPEVNIVEGPMADVCDALGWVRKTLPGIPLRRRDIRVDGERVVAVGWSTGGHLAMTLAWTPIPRGIKPPDAILVFYCPTDYEDPFWTKENIPRGSEKAVALPLGDVHGGLTDRPITGYNLPLRAGTSTGGWMAPDDARSRIALYMNWKGRCLNVLLGGVDGIERPGGKVAKFFKPTPEQIREISPLAQIRRRAYKTPTFIIHGTLDDLIPWKQAQRTADLLAEGGTDSEIRIIEGAIHLFDIYGEYWRNVNQRSAVEDGYEFLRRHIGFT